MHSRCLAFLLFKFWEEGPRGGGGGRISFHFSLVPNVFPNMFNVALHSCFSGDWKNFSFRNLINLGQKPKKTLYLVRICAASIFVYHH